MSTVLLLVLLLAYPAGQGCKALWQRRLRHRTAIARCRQVPDALERMAAALRTGSSLPQALKETADTSDAPLGPELSELARRSDTGTPLPQVLTRWADHRNDRTTRLAAAALVLASRAGASPARAIDGVAATVRERLNLAAERRAQATQARTSAIVLSAAPLAFTGLLVATNSAAAQFLFGTPMGWACLLAGLGLDAAGAAWMARLTSAGEL